MSNSFEILSRFLERFGDDVEGRSLEEPPTDFHLKLKRFAGGALSDTERNEVIALLHANPQWVALLACEAKALRNGAVSE